MINSTPSKLYVNSYSLCDGIEGCVENLFLWLIRSDTGPVYGDCSAKPQGVDHEESDWKRSLHGDNPGAGYWHCTRCHGDISGDDLQSDGAWTRVRPPSDHHGGCQLWNRFK